MEKHPKMTLMLTIFQLKDGLIYPMHYLFQILFFCFDGVLIIIS